MRLGSAARGWWLAAMIPGVAAAHFALQTPTSWMSQDSLGLPEKGPPCGNEGGGTPTGTVTAFHPGDTVTITINEIIFHPGHYRIALANNQTQLPADPPVDAGATACGSVPIESTPVFPVLADNVFPHTVQFTTPQTTQITLPSDFTCDQCTLQIVEFMGDHALNPIGGCFYHHCANISITSSDGGAQDGGAQMDAGASSGSDAGPGAQDSGNGASSDAGAASPISGGCSCASPGGGAAIAALGALLSLALARRQVSKRPRSA
jgi:MYXO-CTERM domain-containing protein